MYSNYGYDSYYTTSQTANQVGALAGAALVFVVIMYIIALAAAIVELIGLWKMFKKAGRKGWEALIPGHDGFVLFEMAGINPIWIIWMMLAGVVMIIPIIGWLAGIAFVIFVEFWVNIKLAKQFGKETGFGVLMAFFPFVMYPILGFGSAKWTAPKKLVNKPGEDK